MIGFRGASRYYDERYRAGFALECRALKRVRDEMGLTNLKIMVPFCRTLDEARRVGEELARQGLRRHDNGLELYMMVEIPSNVILLAEFAEYFDGFSIGSNDLTQLTLGVDRDSEIVAHVFDERDQAVRALIAQAIGQARRLGRKIGLCGQAPSDYPEFARFLVECGIDSMSLNPDAVLSTSRVVLEADPASRPRCRSLRMRSSDGAALADDPSTPRLSAIIDFTEPFGAQLLGDGYRVEVRIVVWRQAHVLKVPVGALFRHGDGWAVFEVDHSRARLRTVSIGERNDKEAQILRGLHAEQSVVLHPPDTLADGARITERRE